MTDCTELIARLRSKESDIDVEAHDLAADALEAQGRRLEEAEESNNRLQQTGLEALTTLAAQDEVLRKSRLRLAEAEALLRDIRDRPRHWNKGAYEVRMYVGDYERIDAFLGRDKP